ncbi:MAG: hypothetical protein AB1540_09895 [Bdellovibrionota bacterium]
MSSYWHSFKNALLLFSFLLFQNTGSAQEEGSAGPRNRLYKPELATPIAASELTQVEEGISFVVRAYRQAKPIDCNHFVGAFALEHLKLPQYDCVARDLFNNVLDVLFVEESGERKNLRFIREHLSVKTIVLELYDDSSNHCTRGKPLRNSESGKFRLTQEGLKISAKYSEVSKVFHRTEDATEKPSCFVAESRALKAQLKQWRENGAPQVLLPLDRLKLKE